MKYDITILNDVYILYTYMYINTHCNTTFKTVDEHIEPRATHKSAIVCVLTNMDVGSIWRKPAPRRKLVSPGPGPMVMYIST